MTDDMLDCGHEPPWPDGFPADSPVRNRLGWSLMVPREVLWKAYMLPCPTCRMERIEQLAADAPKWVNPIHAMFDRLTRLSEQAGLYDTEPEETT